MALEDSVNDLVTATTDLLNAVNVSKVTLDTAVAAADADAYTASESAIASANSAASALAIYGNTTVMNAAVASASTSASTATTKATEAATSATQAANSASSAAAIVTGVASNRPSVRPSLLLDFANTKQLDPRVTFSRASTGTYYDGKTVVKADENLLIRSQEFDTGWGLTTATITANSTTAPDGTATADTFLATGSNAIVNQAQVATSGVDYTFSVWIKRKTGSGIVELACQPGLGYTTVAVDGTWQRFSITRTVTTTSANCVIRLQTSGDEVYIWGAQLEQRSTVTAYTPTTTAPITNYIPALQTAASGTARFDHDPVTGESKGLLIEEQRTNLLTYSEQFDNAAWTKSNSTITANTIVAPDGTLTADKLFENTANSTHDVYKFYTPTAGAVTFSVYVKAAERTQVRLSSFEGSVPSNPVLAIFNLQTGTVISSGGLTTSTSISNVGNGWFRISASGISAGTSSGFLVSPVTSGNAAYTGDGYSGIYIWGAQLEAGSFPTSYIPTVASQVTRSADSASMTGSNFSSWYRQDEGTVYAEASFGGFPSTSNPISASISDGTSNNHIILMEYNTNSRIQAEVKAGGSVQAGLVLQSPISTNVTYKHTLAYKTNDIAACSSGGIVQTDTSATIPVVSQLGIGTLVNGNYTNGTIKRIAFWPKRLSNSELQGITS